ncbi:hypothetical protein [Sinisalibacter aestuarii]|uniref:Uncharacterized protein n=1 Tax=Sinisalibacter aestuarii TaxID=2949426 RepID=A0ABQ5M0L9_9RHOB|nr:hypothetical protein [Sinisalibacter aestuarii]GKY90251.1 hypothetical protein STA1M1_41200 [Sinisalibacter aestuarii]
MKHQPNWRLGLTVYLLYLVVFVRTWTLVGSDHTALVGRDGVFRSVVLPLLLAALFLGSRHKLARLVASGSRG